MAKVARANMGATMYTMGIRFMWKGIMRPLNSRPTRIRSCAIYRTVCELMCIVCDLLCIVCNKQINLYTIYNFIYSTYISNDKKKS